MITRRISTRRTTRHSASWMRNHRREVSIRPMENRHRKDRVAGDHYEHQKGRGGAAAKWGGRVGQWRSLLDLARSAVRRLLAGMRLSKRFNGGRAENIPCTDISFQTFDSMPRPAVPRAECIDRVQLEQDGYWLCRQAAGCDDRRVPAVNKQQLSSFLVEIRIDRNRDRS